MTLLLPYNVVAGQAGEITDTQTAYRMLMAAYSAVLADVAVLDTFTRPDGSIGSADTGQTWSALEGTWTLASERASASGTGLLVADSGLKDVDVSCRVTASGGSPGLVFRGGSTTADRLSVQVDTGGTGLRLEKRIAGTQTLIVSDAATITTGVDYRIRVLAIGDRVQAWLWDPTAGRITADIDYTLTGTDSTTFGATTTYTRVGFRSNSTSATFDNLVARVAYPAGSTTAGTITLADLPAGVMLFAKESGGAYVRPSARTDLAVYFLGTPNPGATQLNYDLWAQLP